MKQKPQSQGSKSRPDASCNFGAIHRSGAAEYGRHSSLAWKEWAILKKNMISVGLPSDYDTLTCQWAKYNELSVRALKDEARKVKVRHRKVIEEENLQTHKLYLLSNQLCANKCRRTALPLSVISECAIPQWAPDLIEGSETAIGSRSM